MKRLTVLVAALYLPLAGAAYKCVDEKGVTHIGDTPPAACANVMLYEVKPSGAVIRRIEPTPTPEQLRVLKEESERKREADKVVAEQKRKDLALLNTYSSERDFDVALDRNIEPIRGRIANAQDRIKVIGDREVKIADEMEFYKAGKSKAHKKGTEADAPPPMLVHEQERLTAEKQSLNASIVSQEKEIVALRARFEADKKRWMELKGVSPATQAASADTPAANGVAKPVRKTY